MSAPCKRLSVADTSNKREEAVHSRAFAEEC